MAKQLTSIIGLAAASFVGFGFANALSTNSRPLSLESSKDGLKVAVIGSGIGGSSAAYFTRELLGANARIDVFEKDTKVGGRMAVVKVDGDAFESGASVIHESNRYVTKFCEIGGYGQVKNNQTSRMGIYNGKEFLFYSSGYSLIDKIKLFFTYGFGLLKMDSFTSGTVKKFEHIYTLQDEGRSFETVQDFLRTLGGDEFVRLTKHSASKELLERGVSKKIIDELATAVSRCNYGQDMNINAFTGFVSLAGAQSSKLWAVKGGNFQVCKTALEKSKANMMFNTEVKKILKRTTEDGKLKYSLITNDSDSDYTYDAVVVAVPLEVKSSQIECEACGNWPSKEEFGRFQRTVATFVKGKLNFGGWGFNSETQLPDDIFTTEDPSLFFNSIGKQKNVHGVRIDSEGRNVYKVFSRDTLSEEDLDKLFVDRTTVKVVDWLAYPHYTPPEKFSPFRLDDGVFYVNAIERVASAMELGAIGGRNAALLAAKYLKEREMEGKRDGFSNKIKGEL